MEMYVMYCIVHVQLYMYYREYFHKLLYTVLYIMNSSFTCKFLDNTSSKKNWALRHDEKKTWEDDSRMASIDTLCTGNDYDVHVRVIEN